MGAPPALALRLPAPAEEHAPGHDRRRAERAGEVVRGRRAAVGVEDPLEREQRELECPDEHRQLPAPVGGDGEEDHEAGRPGRGGDRQDRQRREPELERAPPPPPESEAERRAADRVDDEERPAQPVARAAQERHDAERDRDEEEGRVDDPVAPRARSRGRLVLLRREEPAESAELVHHDPG
jgi:hypothetical protein